MTGCYIHGIGTMSLGLDAPFEEAWAMLETIPIKDYVKPKASRRFGRLSKIIYIAAMRAIADAKVSDPSSLPTVNATCMGEAAASISLLEQIHRTKGKLISPALVPNSVHNAPAGYLSIGLKNQSPAVTVSEGWMSSEAALVTAVDFLNLELAEQVLVFSGDEADPKWGERLSELGAPQLAAILNNEAMQEGAIALVIGKAPGGAKLGSVVTAVERRSLNPDGIVHLMKKNNISIGPNAEVRVRIHAGGEIAQKAASEALDRPIGTIVLDGPGPGTVQAASLNTMVSTIKAKKVDELLLIAAEVDDLAILHWKQEG